MSFDAYDEEWLPKLRQQNPDGLTPQERLFERSKRTGVEATRVCEKHGTEYQPDCPECFPPSQSVSVFDAENRFSYITAWGDRRNNDPSQSRVEIEESDDAHPRKKHRDDICSIGVEDCDWSLEDAVVRGEESLRRFCRILPRQVLAHYFDDPEFSKPIRFDKPKRKHRPSAENAKLDPIPVFAFSESERSFYKDAASRNLNQAELKAKHGEWPMAKIIDLEARIIRHAYKVRLIHLLPGAEEIQRRQLEKMLALFEGRNAGMGFGETKDQKSTISYRDDRAQNRAVAGLSKDQNAAFDAWLEEW